MDYPVEERVMPDDEDQIDSTTRYSRLRWLALVLLVLAAVGAWMFLNPRRSWSVGKVEALIQAEVPPGCSRQQVEDWFSRHNISHGYTEDTTGDMPMLAGLKDSDLSGMVCGEIYSRHYGFRVVRGQSSVPPEHEEPEANVGWLQEGYISIYFFFDKDGRCVGHLVHRFILSL
jgi:hypothetical protein